MVDKVCYSTPSVCFFEQQKLTNIEQKLITVEKHKKKRVPVHPYICVIQFWQMKDPNRQESYTSPFPKQVDHPHKKQKPLLTFFEKPVITFPIHFYLFEKILLLYFFIVGTQKIVLLLFTTCSLQRKYTYIIQSLQCRDV